MKKKNISARKEVVPNSIFKIPIVPNPTPAITPIPPPSEKVPIIYTRSLTDIQFGDAMAATNKANKGQL
jgi:hypothetical protein